MLDNPLENETHLSNEDELERLVCDAVHMVSDKQLIYIASPYSHPDEKIRERRFLQVEELCVKLIKENKVPFSPILYIHNIAKKYGFPTDAKYWQRFNETFMERSNVLYFCLFDGWKESKGMAEELVYAEKLGLYIHYHKPEME